MVTRRTCQRWHPRVPPHICARIPRSGTATRPSATHGCRPAGRSGRVAPAAEAGAPHERRCPPVGHSGDGSAPCTAAIGSREATAPSQARPPSASACPRHTPSGSPVAKPRHRPDTSTPPTARPPPRHAPPRSRGAAPPRSPATNPDTAPTRVPTRGAHRHQATPAEPRQRGPSGRPAKPPPRNQTPPQHERPPEARPCPLSRVANGLGSN
jgi:hypothetical protein